MRNMDYLSWLHESGLPCYTKIWLGRRIQSVSAISNPEEREAKLEDLLSDGSWKCGGRMTADHVGSRPFGRKCNDIESICLCWNHHSARQEYRGLWRGFDGMKMRTWAAMAVAWTNERWLESGGGFSAEEWNDLPGETKARLISLDPKRIDL